MSTPRNTLLALSAGLTACVLLVSADAQQSPSACKPEGGKAVVCARSDQTLRVIHGTTSPDGRLAIAWGFRPGPGVNRDTERIEDDGSEHAAANDAAVNYLVRLSDGAILKKTRGTHFGDRTDYNHTAQRTHWSPNGRLVAEIDNLKWFTPVADIYRIEEGGQPVGPFRLNEFARKAAETEMRKSAKAGKRLKLERYTFTVAADAGPDVGDAQAFRLDDRGAVRFRLYAAIPKADDEEFTYDLSVMVTKSGDRLAGRLASITRVKGD